MGVIIRQSIKGTIVNYIGSFIGFLMTFFIMMRFLSAEEIGLTNVLLNAALLFAGLAQLGTNSSTMRFYPYFKDETKKDHGFFFWTLLVPFIGFFIVLFFFLLFREPITRFFAENSQLFVEYYNYVIPLAFFLLYISVFETNSNVLLRIVIPKFIREIVIRLLLIVVYLLYAFRVLDLTGFVTAFCTVYGAAMILNLIYLFSLKRVSLKPDLAHISKPLKKDFTFYTIFLVTAALGGTITPMINSFFLSAKMGLAYTGVFTVATYIATIVEIPYRSLGAITRPHISQSVKENDIPATNTLCKSVSLHQLLAGIFIFYFIWINIDIIFEILPNGQIYSAGKWAVFFIGMSRLFNSVVSIGTTVLSYSRYYYFSLIFTFMLTAMAIGFNLLLIPVWGITGAAIASLASYVIYFTLLLSLIRWKVGTSIFSMNQLKILAIVIILFILNWLWEKSLGPLIIQLPIQSFYAHIINRLLCSIVMAILAFTAVYKMNISPQVNSLVDKYWKKFSNGIRKRKN